MTLQFLRPAEVDGDGNANTSRIVRDGRVALRLPGGLATADVCRILPRVVLYHTDHQPRSLPERVSFVSGAGGGDARRRHAGPGPPGHRPRACSRSVPAGARLESVHPGEDPAGRRRAHGFPRRDGRRAGDRPAVRGRAGGARRRRSRSRCASSSCAPPAPPRPSASPAPTPDPPSPSPEQEKPCPRCDSTTSPMLVEDLDASIEKWRTLLGILDPGQAGEDHLRRGRGERREDEVGDVQQPERLLDPAVLAGRRRRLPEARSSPSAARWSTTSPSSPPTSTRPSRSCATRTSRSCRTSRPRRTPSRGCAGTSSPPTTRAAC